MRVLDDCGDVEVEFVVEPGTVVSLGAVTDAGGGGPTQVETTELSESDGQRLATWPNSRRAPASVVT
jgi:hypothetical protein